MSVAEQTVCDVEQQDFNSHLKEYISEDILLDGEITCD